MRRRDSSVLSGRSDQVTPGRAAADKSRLEEIPDWTKRKSGGFGAHLVADGHVLDAAHEARAHPRNRASQFHTVHPRRDLAEDHLQLKTRQIGAQTVVFADTKRQVIVGMAPDVEFKRLLEHFLVAIGR